ncbi:hypothetical protein [Achromobacter agilis]|uniref:Uncharacterized protein n=1 Tax=Achromobacter agilis TaxID=1353888 RepID=A0A446C2V2_9BURK|nr:hypothetical protein [Achromobacter agilis]SSW62227.1 hypothetical protein AGI3411_00410 [Achromobacter agilis]
MPGSSNRARARLFVFCLLAGLMPPVWAQPQAAGTPQANGAPFDAEAPVGRNALTAGPEPRVRVQGSPDHAAIFGTEDEDELALAGQERALDTQRSQLKLLERILDSRPAYVDPHPPATIPLNGGVAPMRPLAPAPAGSRLDDAGNGTRRSMDEMQHRVDGLRREADELRQRGR